MSVQPHTVPAGESLRRLRWLFWGVALLVGISVGVVVEVLRTAPARTPELQLSTAPAPPSVSWKAGEHAAPGFALRDESGKPVSLAQFRGRPVLLTFMDPLCTDFCPLEAKVVNAAEARLPAAARPVVIAVSVNTWGNQPKTLRHDARKWRFTDRWRWAVGEHAQLARVWKDYGIGVQQGPGHDVTHTEALYLIDANGDQRALWIWPFRAPDVARTLRALG